MIWNKVSNGLPEDYMRVLIIIKPADDPDSRYTSVGWYSVEEGFMQWDGYEQAYLPVRDVIAWMPLPEPY